MPPSMREPSALAGTIRFLMRTLANVPRIITSWLPRREPYELKSAFVTLFSISQRPAGEESLMDPAGEMWSVVIESPKMPSARAARTPLSCALGFIVKPSKKGGLAMYVDVGHVYTCPETLPTFFHRSPGSDLTLP